MEHLSPSTQQTVATLPSCGRLRLPTLGNPAGSQLWCGWRGSDAYGSGCLLCAVGRVGCYVGEGYPVTASSQITLCARVGRNRGKHIYIHAQLPSALKSQVTASLNRRMSPSREEQRYTYIYAQVPSTLGKHIIISSSCGESATRVTGERCSGSYA